MVFDSVGKKYFLAEPAQIERDVSQLARGLTLGRHQKSHRFDSGNFSTHQSQSGFCDLNREVTQSIILRNKKVLCVLRGP